VLKDSETAPLLCSGSRVLEGLGRCLVIAVGPNSQQGQISSMVAGVETFGDELRCALPVSSLPQPPFVRQQPKMCRPVAISVRPFYCIGWIVLASDNVMTRRLRHIAGSRRSCRRG